MYDLMSVFKLTDGFLWNYQKLVKSTALPYQERALHDEVEGAEKSHAIENFRLAAQLLSDGKISDDANFYGMVFQDSDVYKWLEAVAYSLKNFPDPELEARCDEIIELIGGAQHADGYINTYFTVQAPDKRWTNLHEGHELYCAGHLIEAAVAYSESTGKLRLLEITMLFVDHIYNRFVTQAEAGFPGHPEIELALMKLYRYAGREADLQLALHFIDARGVDSDYFVRERQEYPWVVWGDNSRDKKYFQAHRPVREQTDADGHAVRAAYLYTGMADAAMVSGDTKLKAACEVLWRSITGRRMYITGGIGSIYEGEAFSTDWHLPNDTAYSEGCASVALILFARRMLELDCRVEYADVMERTLFNGVLADMQLDGTRFFYVNPLESVPGVSGEIKSHLHALPERPKWFACSCCAPNVARLISSINKYAWTIRESSVYSHLYISGELDLSESHGIKITVDSQQPYGGLVKYRISTNPAASRYLPDVERPEKLTLAIRLPQWSRKTVITLNGEIVSYKINNGYALIERTFADGDEVVLELDMSVRRNYSNKKVSANSGRVALTRGPLVYCAEGVDNEGSVLDLLLAREHSYTESEHGQLQGVVKLTIAGFRSNTHDTLYSFEKPSLESIGINFIPYYAWSNRGANEMRVWLPEV